MKRLVMMMAMAVGVTCFAASQNDKLISFYTEGPDTYNDGTTVLDGECYALVWVKSGSAFGGFNPDGSAIDATDNAVLQISACAKGGKCDGILFRVAAEADAAYASSGDYRVYLMDTRDAAGVPSAVVDGKVGRVNGCGLCPDAKSAVSSAAPLRVMANLTAAGVEAGINFTTSDAIAYSDHLVVRKGERVVLVGYPATSEKFHGIDWNFRPVMAGETVELIGTVGEGGLIDVEIPSILNSELVYEVAVLDTRDASGEPGPAAEDGKSPKLVRAWALVDNSQQPLVVDWKRVWIGNSGLFYHGITDGGDLINPVIFDYDPSEYLEAGKAAVYGLMGMKDSWFVFDLPKAYVTIADDPKHLRWGAEKGSDEFYCALRQAARGPQDGFQLETEYNFKAYADETEKTVIHEALLVEKREGQPDVLKKAWKMGFDEVLATFTPMDPGVQSGLRKVDSAKAEIFRNWYQHNVPFFQWNCDFEVSFDRDVEKDSFILAGYYAAAADYSCANPKNPDEYWDFSNWVGSSSYLDLPKGKHFRLLWDNDSASVTVNYQEICERVQEFRCGAYNLSSKNWGTTMTVDLNIYENTGRHSETGSKITVGSYKYTFKGPLNVKFYSNDVEYVDLAIATNHDGKSLIGLPQLRVDSKTLAFTGWSNRVDNAVYTNTLPARTWTEKDEHIDLYAIFKEAKSTTVTVSNETGKTETSDFKVTKEWLDARQITAEGDELKKVLNAPEGDAKRPVWQNYLLGMDPNADLKVEKTNGTEDDKALVVSTVQVVAPDAGIKVGYSLDKVDAKEGVEKPGAEQATKDLKIDLEPQDDTPTGYYKMNVIFTPTENGKDRDKITIPADNTIGVLKVETQEPVVPVAVPWSSLEDGTDIPVNEIVKTSTLSEGDLMHVYDQDQKAYVNLKLDANGEWTPVKAYKLDDVGKVTDTTIEIDKIDTKKVTRGSSVWLERKDTSKPFYLIGQYKKGSHATTQIKTKADGAVKPEANLIAPPGIEDTDLNEVVNKDIGAKDQLMIVKEGVPTYFQWKNHKWSYPKQVYTVDEKGRARTTTIWVDNEAVVPAGLGLWYLSDSGTPKIAWPEPTDEQGEDK